ncbi:MAG: POTRA domain-containing protein [Pyrinomonadaceae bacterium]
MNKYITRRLEFIGNEHIRDGVLRRRILLQEGEFLNRGILIRSLINVSKLKLIYPVRLRNVIVKLDNQEKTIDVLICFKERRRVEIK